MKSTQILLAQLYKKGTLTEGTVSIASDGTKYRYDRLVLNAETTNTALELLFEKSCIENGASRFSSNFNDGNNSFHLARAKYKGERNGKITISIYKQLN